MRKQKEPTAKGEQGERKGSLTLFPLTVEQALGRLLKAKPPSKDAPEPKSPQKKADAS